MRTLSITQAWDEALAVLRREGSLIFPVALALIGLPIVLFQLAMPDTAPGANPEVGPWLVFIIPLAVVSVLGSLTITILALRGGISVGEALAAGARRILPVLGASIILTALIGIATFVLVLVLALVVALIGGGALAASALAVIVLVPLFALFWARIMMMIPVAAAEGAGSSAMIKRSWALARGHTAKLLGFAILVSLGAGIIMIAVTMVLGSVIALLLGRPEPANLSFVILLLIGGALNTLWGAFYAVIVARIYTQLADEPSTGI